MSAGRSTVRPMDYDPKTLEDAQTHVHDYESDQLAPLVMWGGLVLLQDAEPLLGSMARCKLDKDLTTWRVLWVTETRVIFAEASKQLEGWTAYTPDQGGGADADSLVTWCRPLADVERLELVEQTAARERHYSELRTWETNARLVLRDGPTIDLPLFGGRPGYRSREAVDALITALVGKLWR